MVSDLSSTSALDPIQNRSSASIFKDSKSSLKQIRIKEIAEQILSSIPYKDELKSTFKVVFKLAIAVSVAKIIIRIILAPLSTIAANPFIWGGVALCIFISKTAPVRTNFTPPMSERTLIHDPESNTYYL